MPAATASKLEPAFSSIVCGIDGSRAGAEAARQASVLAEPGAELSFVCVAFTRGAGPAKQANIARFRAEAALEDAAALAARHGIAAEATVLAKEDVADTLLAAASRCELLVVGSHDLSRRAGIWLGSVASGAVHKAPAAVLVARAPQDAIRFPSRILVASDGSDGSDAAIDAAARLARSHDADVILAHAGDGETPGDRQARTDQRTRLTQATGTDPAIVTEPGPAHQMIIDVAAGERVPLVVVGSRGLGGLKALGSVSERVAHRAPCSVLIAR